MSSNNKTTPQTTSAPEKTRPAHLTRKDTITDRIKALYAVGITNHTYSVMQSTDPTKDPVAAQYVPQEQELIIHPEERTDPIGDNAHSPVKGIIHRYPDRVLYKITTLCPVYCRYCFRKSMVGPKADSPMKKSDHSVALDYIKNTPTISEVILSGGDPLILSASQIAQTLDAIEAVSHIDLMRIHTRTPIADPARITDDMASALTRDKALTIILHINHVQEITPEVITAIKKLQKTGAMLLAQSVLLKDINDDAQTLETLFRKLISLKIKPYMLHHLDPAPGTQHFRVPISKGQNIMRTLRGNLSGIALPEYMLDIPGGHGKVPLTPAHCTSGDEEGTYTLTDPNGNTHAYPPKQQ